MAIVTCKMGFGHMATLQQVVQRHVTHTVSLPCKTMAGVCAETPTAPRRNTGRLTTVNAETLVQARQVDVVVLDGAMRCTDPRVAFIFIMAPQVQTLVVQLVSA